MKIHAYKTLAFICLTMSLCASCAPHTNNGLTKRQSTYIEAPGDVSTVHSNQRYIITEPINMLSSDTQVGNFNSQLIFLADQLERNIDRKILSNTFIVTSFANLDKLNETTSFGRLVAENLIHELQVRHWQVFDVRLTKDIIINETGEFSLSRDIKKIRDTYKVGGILAGTYSIINNHLIINARVIYIDSGIVASAGQIHLPLNNFAESLLYNTGSIEVKTTMKIVGDGNDK